MNAYKKLISALRCSANVCNGKCDENCPYRTLEEIHPDFPIKADVTINGIGYWESCDCDRMVLDAADAVEQLVAERDDEREAADEWQHGYFELARKCSQLEKERDAAVADFNQFAIYAASKESFACEWCKSQRGDGRCQWFIDHKDDKTCRGVHFEWRGVREDNDDID